MGVLLRESCRIRHAKRSSVGFGRKSARIPAHSRAYDPWPRQHPASPAVGGEPRWPPIEGIRRAGLASHRAEGIDHGLWRTQSAGRRVSHAPGRCQTDVGTIQLRSNAQAATPSDARMACLMSMCVAPALARRP